jgi:hypothetical protein
MLTILNLLELIKESPEIIAEMSHEIKSDSFLENSGYELPLGSKCIFSVMEDERRGFWINIVEGNNEIKLLQFQAGREGDDDIKTYCLDKEYFLDQYTIESGGYLSSECVISTMDTKVEECFYEYDVVESIKQSKRVYMEN